MKAIDELTKLIIISFSTSLNQKGTLIEQEFELEIKRIARFAYTIGVEAGRKEEADRIKEYGDKFSTGPETTMKTKPGIHGTLYSVDGLLWYSTPKTAQASYERQSK